MSKSDPYRVLYVENGIGYGGAVICLRHLIRNIDRSRFEPFVVTGRTGSQYRQISSEASWYHITDRIFDVEQLRRLIDKTSIFNSHLILKYIMHQILARFDDAVNFFPFFLRLFFLSLHVRPHLIHINNEPLCNRAGIFIGKIFSIPIICHVRGNLDGSKLMKWLYRMPDHFVAVSHWVCEGIGNLGVPAEKRTVVYDGIAMDELDVNSDSSVFRKKFDIPEKAFAVGLVGMLIPWKGQRLFLDAAKILFLKVPNLVMLLVGGTPDEGVQYERELKQQVVKDGIEKNVIFTGHVDDMCSVYNGLDVVVSASTSPEPLGTVVIECMAVGRALVVPNHGGGAEMNTHRKTALVFKAGDAESLARTIFEFYENPELRDRLGRQARQQALATFDVVTHARQIEQVYEKVLKG